MSSLALVPQHNTNRSDVKQHSDLTLSSSLAERLTYAEHFAASALFTDIRGAAQALVKIQAGAELGFPPYASMNGISIIAGKACIGGGMYAALIEASPGHDLEILETDKQHAVGRFHLLSARTGQWRVAGEFTFTIEDAARMGLAGKDNWRKSPQQMLLWRMIANGARIYFPALCAGLYIPEELNSAAPADEQGQIIDVQSKPVSASRTMQQTMNAETTTINADTSALRTEAERSVDAAVVDGTSGRVAIVAEIKARRLDCLKAWRVHPTNKEEHLRLVIQRPLAPGYTTPDGREVSAVSATFREMTPLELDAAERFLTTGEIPPFEGDEGEAPDADIDGDELPDPFLDETSDTEINAEINAEVRETLPGLVNPDEQSNEQTLNAINGNSRKKK